MTKTCGVRENDFGRSMIEMLGVLAIVGILSIGAISGFQKAMFKHKLQKATEDLTVLIQNALIYKKELVALRKGFKPGEGSHYKIAELLYNMNIVPANWQRSGDYLYDRLNNKIGSMIRRENNRLEFSISLTTDDTTIFICEAIYRDVIMQFSDDLFYVATWRYDGEGAGSQAFTRYGNLYCKGTTKKCVRDMTLTDIRNTCSVCAKDDRMCVIMIDF